VHKGPHGGGNRHVDIDDVYERKETIRNEQPTAHLQRMEEQFDRFGDQFEAIGTKIGVLTEQFAAMGGANGHHCQPNPRFTEMEDNYSVEGEPVNLFVEHRAGRQRPLE
jgi:hypothetical protein